MTYPSLSVILRAIAAESYDLAAIATGGVSDFFR